MPPGPPKTPFERKSALEAPLGPPKNFKSARTRALRASKSVCEAAKARAKPEAPEANFGIFEMDLDGFQIHFMP